MTTEDNNIIELLNAATDKEAPAESHQDSAAEAVPETASDSPSPTPPAEESSPSAPDQPAKHHERTIEDIVNEEAKEESDKPVSSFSLNRTLGGVIMARAIQKQIWLVLLIALFLIIYISNRYTCQKQTVTIDKLEKKLANARYKATVCTSMLTEKSRESNIIKMLNAHGDSTLTIPEEPPYLIKVEK